MKIKNHYKKYFILILIVILIVFIYIFNFLELKHENNKISKIKNEIRLKKEREIKKLLDKQREQIDFLNNLDLKTDDSLTKFVSAKVSFNDKKYIPKNLVYLSGSFIIDGKTNQKLRQETLEALNRMSEAYFRDTGDKIVIVSAYRSYFYQKGIKDRGCPDNLCAKAGYSEHQSGLAVDLWSASSYNYWQKEPYKSRYIWLKENAYKFGFHNTYQKGLKIDTYEIEPWHWRYLGERLAKYLLDNNMTFAEFYNKMEQH